MNLQTALKTIRTQKYPWNKVKIVKIVLLLHSYSYIHVEKYNVISTCYGWIAVWFFPPTPSPSFSFLLLIFLWFLRLLPILTSGCNLCSPAFLYCSFFHSFTYYFERRWVHITNIQCILQMIKFNRLLK